MLKLLSSAMKADSSRRTQSTFVLQQPLDRVWGRRRVDCAGQRAMIQGDGCVVMCGICGVFYSDRTQRVNRDRWWR